MTTGTALNIGNLTIWTGDLGLTIYEEIHHDMNNRVLHIAFLPWVFYGVFRGIPALATHKYDRPYGLAIIVAIQFAYFLFYSITNVTGALDTVWAMAPISLLAMWKLRCIAFKSSCDQLLPTSGRTLHMFYSLFIAVTALVIQEVIGHYLWEKEPSRISFSYVLNALLYSPVFYAANWVECFQTYPISRVPLGLLAVIDILY